LIQFSGSVDDGHNRKLANTINFYSLGDDADTDNSTDTKDKSIFDVKPDGSCLLVFTTGKTCSIDEADLSGESDTVNGSQISFDGKTRYIQKDGKIITLPSLAGASGYAFTSVKDQIGGAPNYPDRFIRYVFVSDTECEPKAPSPKSQGNDSLVCSAPAPESRPTVPLVAALVALLWLRRQRHAFSGAGWR
jgi:MYXO-CTERM domain-containing protein